MTATGPTGPAPASGGNSLIKTILNALFKPLLIILAIAIAGFLFIHFLWPKVSPTVTLPGGQVVSLDTQAFNASVKQMNKQLADQSKKINDLESTIRQTQTHTVEQDIPGALRETNIRASVDRMKEAWKR